MGGEIRASRGVGAGAALAAFGRAYGAGRVTVVSTMDGACTRLWPECVRGGPGGPATRAAIGVCDIPRRPSPRPTSFLPRAALKAKFLDGPSRRAANEAMMDMSVEAGGRFKNAQTVDIITVGFGTTVLWIV